MPSAETYMQRCLQIAKLGSGRTAPNPMVGAVLVYQDTIIGEGWHAYYGGPHAEVNCLQSVSEANKALIPLATMYVSLEPCAHYGKTPPCAQLLIDHQILEVVIGCVDDFASVSGRGIALLKEAGVAVTVGVLEEACKRINRHFFTYHALARPYIILKWAATSDGFVAPLNEGNFRISNAYTQLLLHKWRATIPGFLLGFNTIVKDDPKLSNRYWNAHQQPTRIVLDPHNELPCNKQIFDGSLPTLVYNQHFVLDGAMTQWVKISNQDFISGVLEDLYNKQINAVVVEGGSKTLQLFIDRGLFDEIIVFEAPSMLMEGILAPLFEPSTQYNSYRLADNTVTHYYYSQL